MTTLSRWRAEFYCDAGGAYPVKAWILSLPPKDQARIARTIELLETYGTQLTMPHCRHARGKLWELRTGVGRHDYRVLYFAVAGQRFILLHGFDKKTAKLPDRELEIAERRMSEHVAREERQRYGKSK